VPKIPHGGRRFLRVRRATPAPMMAAMKSISLRSQRIAQVKFVSLPLDPPLVPPCLPRREARISRSEARFMRWLRRFAIRVIGSTMAARP